MVKNMETYYSIQDYGVAPPEYQRKAMWTEVWPWTGSAYMNMNNLSEIQVCGKNGGAIWRVRNVPREVHGSEMNSEKGKENPVSSSVKMNFLGYFSVPWYT